MVFYSVAKLLAYSISAQSFGKNSISAQRSFCSVLLIGVLFIGLCEPSPYLGLVQKT